MQEQLIVIIVLGIMIYSAFTPAINTTYAFFLGIYRPLHAIVTFIVNLATVRRTLFFISSLPVLYGLYRVKEIIVHKLWERNNHVLYLKKEQQEINQLLVVETETLNLEALRKFVSELQDKLTLSKKLAKLARFEKPLVEQLQDAREALRELKYATKVDELDFKKEKIRLEIVALKEEKKREEDREKDRLWEIESNLHMHKRNAFFRDSLNYEEKKILRAHGYEEANEYDILRKKILPVFVKKIMNHTHQHTFLVWSVERFLEMVDGVQYLQHHDTRWPDITFTYDDVDYALEIETGPLLRKKTQARKKVHYLNKHYPGRWMFIVSNKNLLPAYRKLGPATQRSRVVNVIKEMLEIAI